MEQSRQVEVAFYLVAREDYRQLCIFKNKVGLLCLKSTDDSFDFEDSLQMLGRVTCRCAEDATAAEETLATFLCVSLCLGGNKLNYLILD